MDEFWKKIMIEARKINAADIYILPENDDNYMIRFHDGHKLVDYQKVKVIQAERLLTYLKYRAQMNIAEKRRPQLGSFQEIYNNQKIWLRLSSVGNFQDVETLVIRILTKPNETTIHWLEEKQFTELLDGLPSAGLVIIAGPTGSGKTTTIHQLLERIVEDKLILSIEDPVEIQNNKIVQLQVNEQAGMDYFQLIKVALRHHPDILMVGEIRDLKTANAALRASLSGHLVISTLHANSAKAVLDRLIDLELDKNLLKQALSMIIYQRLISTKNGLAAIANYLIGDEIYINQNKDRWREILDANYQKNIISKKEYDRFIKMAH